MKQIPRLMLVVMMTIAIIVPVSAQDKKKRKKKKGGNRGGAVAQLVGRINKVDGVTAEQKEKIKKIIAELGPKVTEAQKKATAVFTAEQRKARSAARKKASGEGKKGQALQKAVNAAVDLSEEQKKKRAETLKEQRTAMLALNRAIAKVLTPEQRKAARVFTGRGKNANKKKGKGKGKKKKKADN